MRLTIDLSLDDRGVTSAEKLSMDLLLHQKKNFFPPKVIAF